MRREARKGERKEIRQERQGRAGGQEGQEESRMIVFGLVGNLDIGSTQQILVEVKN